MHPREFHRAEAVNAAELTDCPQAEYRISIPLAVSDLTALWSAAATKALSMPGATLEDVVDTIGLREAPSVSECIAMLAGPSAIPGCVVDDFWIDAMPGLPSQTDLLEASIAAKSVGPALTLSGRAT